MILALVVPFYLALYRMDGDNAILNGDLKEDVYVDTPEGIHVRNETGLVC